MASPAGYILIRQRRPSGPLTGQCGLKEEPDGCCITDPDTRVGLLQAQACNMRSKCRCSCVLQFTLCHAFSCVLHRPPSQLIHCIALYFGYQYLTTDELKEKTPFSTNSFPGGKLHETPCDWRGSLLRLRYLSQRGSQPPANPGQRAQERQPTWRSTADKPRILDDRVLADPATRNVKAFGHTLGAYQTFNDPSAGSPTETLLRLLLPLSATVWSSFRQLGRVNRQANNPRTSLKHSIGSSDGRCVQRAGT